MAQLCIHEDTTLCSLCVLRDRLPENGSDTQHGQCLCSLSASTRAGNVTRRFAMVKAGLAVEATMTQPTTGAYRSTRPGEITVGRGRRGLERLQWQSIDSH